MKLGIRILLLASMLIATQSVLSQTFGNAYFRIISSLDDEKSLDVVNNGENNTLRMANTGNVTGQSWLVTPIGKTGYYRLTTQWQGKGKSLDVVNDGANNEICLAKTEDVAGQYWKITKIGEDLYSISNKWQPKKFLTANPDGSVRLEKFDTDLGQQWTFVVTDNLETN